MLQSFIGTFDSAGLRSFITEEPSAVTRRSHREHVVEFWAVLDTDELPLIQKAFLLGHRGTALELIGQQAKWLGRIYE